MGRAGINEALSLFYGNTESTMETKQNRTTNLQTPVRKMRKVTVVEELRC